MSAKRDTGTVRTAVLRAAVPCMLAASLLTTAGLTVVFGSTPEASAAVSVDRSPAAAASQAPPADENAQGVFFVNGQLRINLNSVSIVDVLNRVSSLTGVRIDIPPEASSKLLPVVKIGPAPARDALSSLLAGMHLGYIIQAAENDPDKLQAVVIMALPPNKPGRPDATETAAAPRFSAPARPAMVPTVEPGPVQPDVAAATASPAPSDNAPPMTAAVETPEPSAGAFSDGGAGSRPGALAPPAVLSPTSINQQLQQMYQQRMQMMQQVKSSPAGASGTAAPASGTGPGAL